MAGQSEAIGRGARRKLQKQPTNRDSARMGQRTAYGPISAHVCTGMIILNDI
jgi:hypothetical protein|eukprot:SAG25_NODE_1746_length_2408_cov_1.489822_2_plen_52_part_00